MTGGTLCLLEVDVFAHDMHTSMCYENVVYLQDVQRRYANCMFISIHTHGYHAGYDISRYVSLTTYVGTVDSACNGTVAESLKRRKIHITHVCKYAHERGGNTSNYIS